MKSLHEDGMPYDVEEIRLEGQDTGTVPIFDTYDDVRRKIRNFPNRRHVSKPPFLWALARCRPRPKEYKTKTMSGSSLEKFMKQKGLSAGCESIIFYVAYVFFEKVRLRDRKSKTELQEKMEEVWKTYRDPTTGKMASWREGAPEATGRQGAGWGQIWHSPVRS
jgi:hypothetical protein